MENKRRSALLQLQPLVWFAVLLLMYGVRYEVNDDAILSCIASGAYGADTVHLCYVNIAVGWLLRPFYLLAPGLNWYAVLLETLNLGCLVLLCRRSLARFGDWTGSFLFAGFMLLAGFNLLQSLQYTKTAGLAAVLGALQLARAVRGEGRRLYAKAAVLLAAGAALRWDILPAVLALAAPLLLYSLLQRPRGRERLKALGAAALCGVLCAALYAADALAYRAPEWAAYRSYNAVRTQISDYRFQFVGLETAGQYGLSEADYYMISTWDYGDAQLYPAEELRQLADRLPHRTLKNAAREMLHTLPDDLFTNASDAPLSNRIGWMPVLVLLAWLCFGRLRRAGWTAATAAVLLALYYYLSWQARLPFRVLWVLFLATAVFLLALWRPRPAPLPRALPVFLLAVLAVGCFSSYRQGYTVSVQWRADHGAASEAAYDAMSADKEHLYLVSVSQIDAIHGKDVWHTRPAGYFSNITFLGGWLAQSPLYRDTAAAWGLGDGLLSGAVDNPAVRVVDFANIDDKLAALHEHLGLSVAANPVVTSNPNWTAYELVSAEG